MEESGYVVEVKRWEARPWQFGHQVCRYRVRARCRHCRMVFCSWTTWDGGLSEADALAVDKRAPQQCALCRHEIARKFPKARLRPWERGYRAKKRKEEEGEIEEGEEETPDEDV
jgi:hypothetical protein